MRSIAWFCLILTLCTTGCKKKPGSGNVPAVHPVKGVVLKNGQHVTNGDLEIRPVQELPNLLVSAVLKPDGTFEVFSMDTQDRDGKKHPGAPEGSYQLTYSVQTQDQQIQSVKLSKPFVVEAKPNEWIVNLDEK